MKEKILKRIAIIEKKSKHIDKNTFELLEKAKDLCAENNNINAMFQIYGDLLMIKPK